ncbi:MAG TPA: YHS domain-containing (seleno)protein [Dongiaceae bacterium]|jgi:YHS domain-containing protein|nr:YHS domain-containing (seleno)protein [Dongiaceae bacterium]
MMNRSATTGCLSAAVITIALLSADTATAEERTSVNTGYFGNVAILGYDPVAYFTDGRAVQGLPEIKQSWLGATWYFASTQHRDTFAADPISYAPQYGGFCAGSVSVGLITDNIDPESWRIIDGRLYLFGGTGGIEQDFDPAAAKIIADAEAHWPEVKKKIQGQ